MMKQHTRGSYLPLSPWPHLTQRPALLCTGVIHPYPRPLTDLCRPLGTGYQSYDEAAHARELSTLTPLAFFNAKTCIFIGDHR